MPNDENIYRIITPRAPVVTAAEPSEPEWNDLQGRVQSLEDDPELLAELDDVNPTGDAGTVLVKLADGTFAFGNQVGSINRVGNANDPSASEFNVSYISVRRGIRMVPTGTDGTVWLESQFGDGADTVAEGNHTHQLPTVIREPITPAAYMSGGTRQLASRSVTLPAGKQCLVNASLAFQIRGGDPGPAYYRLILTIDGNTRTSGAGTSGFWAVQGVPDKALWGHARHISGTGAAINVSASVSYHDGSGFYTDAGELTIDLTYDH